MVATFTPTQRKPAQTLRAPKAHSGRFDPLKQTTSQEKAVSKLNRFYPAEDVKTRTAMRKVVKPTKLRKSIAPGTVLILLAGKYAGKRVVFLKQLDSGLLLITGPRKINGVPMRRVNQRYVIATSTSIDISSVKLPETVNDAYFAKPAEKKGSKESQFFKNGEKEKTPYPQEKADAQKALDSQLLSTIKKTEFLSAYLNASFSLSKGQAPHLMKF